MTSTAPPQATPTFGLISEGPSDFVVIRHVLAGLLATPDVTLNALQPITDATGGLKTPGGWVEVLRFCGSSRFEAAFQFNDYLIVQIDADVCEERGFDVPRRDPAGQGSLNEKLGKTEGFSIDPQDKQVVYYRRISRPFIKQKTVRSCAQYNPSFAAFVEQVTRLFPAPG